MTKLIRQIATTLILVFGAFATFMSVVVDWGEFKETMFGEDQAMLSSLSTLDAILISAVWCVVGGLIWLTWRKDRAELPNVGNEVRLLMIMGNAISRWCDEGATPKDVNGLISGFIQIARTTLPYRTAKEVIRLLSDEGKENTYRVFDATCYLGGIAAKDRGVPMPMNLKEAQKKGKLDKFIEEHEADEPADKARFNRALEKMERADSSSTPPSQKQTPEPDGGTSP